MTTDHTADGTTVDRAPGRPYFEPRGARFRDARLETERRDYGRKTHGGYRYDFDDLERSPAEQPLIDQALRVLDELRSSIDGIRKLYGPGAAAALLGETTHPVGREPWPGEVLRQDRLDALNSIARRLDGQRADAHANASSNESEVRRLEGELAAAQDAYDREHQAAVECDRIRAEWSIGTVYAAELERAIERLSTRWTAGHAARTIHLAAARADAQHVGVDDADGESE